MTPLIPSRPTVAIIGGGFTGAAVAFHLARSGADTEILVFEPRAALGAGLAYGTTDPNHRINVPATKMTLLPDDETHFARWLEARDAMTEDPGAISGGLAYPSRRSFGRYMSQSLEPFVDRGAIRHVAERVASLAKSRGAWRVRTATGATHAADLAIIATTHPTPNLPEGLAAFTADPRLVCDGLAEGALDAIEPDDRLLIVGSGLTAADIVASLDARGHRGGITLISRRGQRPRGHALRAEPAEGDFSTRPAGTAAQLLRDIRRQVRAAIANGKTWHPVLDAVRTQGDAIWSALPAPERQRLVRHVRPFWDAHRFRIAPQVDAILSRRLSDGSAELIAASLQSVERGTAGFAVELSARGRRDLVHRTVDRILVATGPAHGDILRTQSYLAGLSGAGAVALDATGLGLRTSRDGRAIGASGTAERSLFVAGPLARGTFGELMGMPEVSDYALFIAREIERALSERRLPLKPAAGRIR